MKLVFIRHAIAENKEIFAETGKSDRLRPLTIRGRKKFKKSLSAILALVGKPDLIASSPLLRAMQTAELFNDIYPKIKIQKVKELEPAAAPPQLLTWLQSYQQLATIVVVGHEPHLSSCISFLLTGNAKSIIQLRKGSVAEIIFQGKLLAGSGKLNYLIQATELRKLDGNNT